MSTTKSAHITGIYTLLATVLTIATMFYLDCKKTEKGKISEDPETLEQEKADTAAQGENNAPLPAPNNDKKSNNNNTTSSSSTTNSTSNTNTKTATSATSGTFVIGNIYQIHHRRSLDPGYCGLALRTRPLSASEIKIINVCQGSGKLSTPCKTIDETTYTGICIEHGRKVKYLGVNGRYFKVLDLDTGREGFISKSFSKETTLR